MHINMYIVLTCFHHCIVSYCTIHAHHDSVYTVSLGWMFELFQISHSDEQYFVNTVRHVCGCEDLSRNC